LAIIQFAKKNRKDLIINKGEVLMKGLLAQQVPVASSCKGDGICGKCRMLITAGAENVSAVSEIEIGLIQKNKFPSGTRISCQVIILGGDKDVIEVDTGYW